MNEMKAVVAHGPADLRVDTVPVPTPGPGEVLMQVAYAGICGSDLGYAFKGASGTAILHEPLVLGHEISGTVVEVGDDVDPALVGVKASAYPATVVGDDVLPERIAERHNLYPSVRYFGSAAMRPHTDGGMCEFKVMRADQLRPLPAGLDLKSAALAEPLAVALHAINRTRDYLADGVAGRTVLVNGAGPIGLLVVAGAKALGAARVVAADMAEPALKRARELGADATVLVGTEKLPGDVEVVFESSGAPGALGGVLQAVARGGLLIQVGNLPADEVKAVLGQLVTREITWAGSFRFVDEMDQALALLADGLYVDPLMSHEFPIEEAVEAFNVAADRTTGSSKVMIKIS
ncbi:L-idonate 5-dehydrogenase [Trueperella bernardiae]|uniref:L-idonate 5-dehydrogenase n=1 Tax=Trueperella bernardiae TaxID=59561 RepID=UPI001C5469F3|nr:L-idonate 5-dehydrogenase [Trueperella bernardiae]